MDIVDSVIVTGLGLLFAFISRYGIEAGKKLLGESRLASYASRTITLALSRGVRILQQEIDVNGWQPDDANKALRESARVILASATTEEAIDMYLNELPNWLKGVAFASKDDAAIKRNPRSLEVIESQLSDAAYNKLTNDDRQIALADTWFMKSKSR